MRLVTPPDKMNKHLPKFNVVSVYSSTLENNRLVITLPSKLGTYVQKNWGKRKAKTTTAETQAQSVPSEPPTLSLRQAVTVVNEFKRQYGEDLHLSISPEGLLTAMVSYT